MASRARKLKGLFRGKSSAFRRSVTITKGKTIGFEVEEQCGVLVVTSVTAGGPASSKVFSGDIILSVGGHATDYSQWVTLMAIKEPGTKITMLVQDPTPLSPPHGGASMSRESEEEFHSVESRVGSASKPPRLRRRLRSVLKSLASPTSSAHSEARDRASSAESDFWRRGDSRGSSVRSEAPPSMPASPTGPPPPPKWEASRMSPRLLEPPPHAQAIAEESSDDAFEDAVETTAALTLMGPGGGANRGATSDFTINANGYITMAGVKGGNGSQFRVPAVSVHRDSIAGGDGNYMVFIKGHETPPLHSNDAGSERAESTSPDEFVDLEDDGGPMSLRPIHAPRPAPRPLVASEPAMSLCSSTASSAQRMADTWFAGAITAQRAESVLRGAADGSFLVRASQTRPGEYSLTLSYQQQTEHIQIRHFAHGYALSGTRVFLSIPELVDFYTHRMLSDHFSKLHTELRIPCGGRGDLPVLQAIFQSGLQPFVDRLERALSNPHGL